MVSEQLGIQFPEDNLSNGSTNPIEPVEKMEYFTPEKIEEIRKQLIKDCKVGSGLIDFLTYTKGELNENNIMSGWYIKDQKLKEWDDMYSNIDDIKDNQPSYHHK